MHVVDDEFEQEPACMTLAGHILSLLDDVSAPLVCSSSALVHLKMS